MQAEVEDRAKKNKVLLESLISAGTSNNCLSGKNHMQALPLGPMIRKDMRVNAWTGNANWQIRKSNNYTRSPHFVWMITKSKMKDWKQLETCQTLVRKSS